MQKKILSDLKERKREIKVKGQKQETAEGGQSLFVLSFFSHEMSWMRSWVSFWGFSYLLFEAWSKKGSQVSDDWFYSYIEPDCTHILQLKKCKKKRKGTLFAILLPNRFALRRVHFPLTLLKNCISINLHAVCSRNAKRTYFIFRNDYSLPLQDRLKKDKEKRSRKNKRYPNRHMMSKWCQNNVVLTSIRRRHVASTSGRRYFDIVYLLGYLWSKSNPRGAHGVLLTSMRRDYVASTSIWRHVDTLNCFTCLSK